jgi:uncharacterized membrane protein YidH (DUF202 family)
MAAATLQDIIGTTSLGLVNSVIILLIGLAMLYFIWGIVEFIGKSGDEEGRKEGKSKMIWGIIALFVIVSMWGLVGLLTNTFLDGKNGTAPPPPQFTN